MERVDLYGGPANGARLNVAEGINELALPIKSAAHFMMEAKKLKAILPTEEARYRRSTVTRTIFVYQP